MFDELVRLGTAKPLPRIAYRDPIAFVTWEMRETAYPERVVRDAIRITTALLRASNDFYG